MDHDFAHLEQPPELICVLPLFCPEFITAVRTPTSDTLSEFYPPDLRRPEEGRALRAADEEESVWDSHAGAATTTSLLACIREIPSNLVPMTTNHARDSMTKMRFTTPINPIDPEAPREKKYRSRAEVTNPVATE